MLRQNIRFYKNTNTKECKMKSKIPSDVKTRSVFGHQFKNVQQHLGPLNFQGNVARMLCHESGTENGNCAHPAHSIHKLKNSLWKYFYFFTLLELEPQLEMAKDGVLLVAQQNAKNSRGLDIIKKELEKLPLCKYCNVSK